VLPRLRSRLRSRPLLKVATSHGRPPTLPTLPQGCVAVACWSISSTMSSIAIHWCSLTLMYSIREDHLFEISSRLRQSGTYSVPDNKSRMRRLNILSDQWSLSAFHNFDFISYETVQLSTCSIFCLKNMKILFLFLLEGIFHYTFSNISQQVLCPTD